MGKSSKKLNSVLFWIFFIIGCCFLRVEPVQADTITVYPDPASGVAPLEVKLRCYVDRNTSEPASYTIDFGDGSETETVETNSYSYTFTHIYNNGFYKPICSVIKAEIAQMSESKPGKVIVAKWKFETGGDIDCSPAVGPDGNVYVGSDDGNFYAIDSDTGEERWRFSTGGEIRSSPAIGPNGTIYFGSLDNNLYSLSSGGNLRWALNLGDYIFSSPAVSADGASIYVGASNNNVFKISRSGVVSHTFKTEGKVVSSPSIGNDGIEDVVYVGSLDKHLYALAADNLNLKWKFKANAEIYGSPAISSSGQIYIGECRPGDADEYNFNFYSINVDGSKLWQFNGGTGFYSSPAIGPDDIIYVGSWDGRFYAFNPDGSQIWTQTSFPLADFNSSPAVGSNGVIYVGCKNGAFYGLQSPEVDDDLKEDWVFMTDDPILDSSAAIDSEGNIYFGSRDNSLYAINPGNIAIAESSWPMFGNTPDRNSVTSDIILPQIISTMPANGNSNASIETSDIRVNFSPEINPSLIQVESFTLEKKITGASNEIVEGEFYIESSRYSSNSAFIATAIFEILDPEEQIEYASQYNAKITYSIVINENEASSTDDPDAIVPEEFSWKFKIEADPEKENSGSGGESCFINTL